MGGYQGVKRTLCAIVAVVVLVVSLASTAFASGDKVMGERGLGEVTQVQVQDPPPFQ